MVQTTIPDDCILYAEAFELAGQTMFGEEWISNLTWRERRALHYARRGLLHLELNTNSIETLARGTQMEAPFGEAEVRETLVRNALRDAQHSEVRLWFEQWALYDIVREGVEVLERSAFERAWQELKSEQPNTPALDNEGTPDEQSSIASRAILGAQSRPEMSRRGRPPRYPWNKMYIEIIKRHATLPDVHARLQEEMATWWHQTIDDEPSDSLLKAHISVLYEASETD